MVIEDVQSEVVKQWVDSVGGVDVAMRRLVAHGLTPLKARRICEVRIRAIGVFPARILKAEMAKDGYHFPDSAEKTAEVPKSEKPDLVLNIRLKPTLATVVNKLADQYSVPPEAVVTILLHNSIGARYANARKTALSLNPEAES